MQALSLELREPEFHDLKVQLGRPFVIRLGFAHGPWNGCLYDSERLEAIEFLTHIGCAGTDYAFVDNSIFFCNERDATLFYMRFR